MTRDPGKSELGRMLLEAMDAMPDHEGTPTREILFYHNEYQALDKACQDQFGQTLPQYLGDYWKPTIIQPMPTDDLPAPFMVTGEMACYFEADRATVESLAWYQRLWHRYLRFCAHVLSRKDR